MIKLIFGILGAMFGIVAVLTLIFVYRIWHKKRKEKAIHNRYINSIRAQVSSNIGTIWFHLPELEHATDGFSPKNCVGQGRYGIVHKGKLKDSSTVVVKQLVDLDSQRDEEFSNEVEIISKIRNRNLLPL
ncbi:hypothetical protein Ancab_040088 [Ancistrocladus abbreviatus]